MKPEDVCSWAVSVPSGIVCNHVYAVVVVRFDSRCSRE